MKGYKGFNQDLTCRDFQYEVGKTYEMTGVIGLCSRGFHFCQTLTDCFDYYDKHSSRFCEIETGELVVKGSDKCCTNKITIVRELSRFEINRAIYGNGDGYGDGDGYGNGDGDGYGDGYGYGYGYGDGDGYGNGDGFGYGYGYGDGNGYGYGYGDGKNIQKILIFKEIA